MKKKKREVYRSESITIGLTMKEIDSYLRDYNVRPFVMKRMLKSKLISTEWGKAIGKLLKFCEKYENKKLTPSIVNEYFSNKLKQCKKNLSTKECKV